MRLYRILITSTTASFRYPNLITSNQLSIKAVPYTTIAGLIASAVGKYINDFNFSYTFRYLSKFVDLETIYKFAKKGESVDNKNVISDKFKREILFDCYLSLYVDSKDIADAFKEPLFQLLLGRSSDIAKVVEVKEIEAIKTDKAILNGTIVPFNEYKSFGEIYSLPRCFDYSDIVRKPQKVEPFLINDGIGVFVYEPLNIQEKFDLKNWKFKKMLNVIETTAYLDEELNTPILLRKLC